jgi:hypothetical protein
VPDENDNNMHEGASEMTPAEAGKKAAMKWYVVQVYSGYEQKVKLSLAERVKQASIESDFGEILIPTETVQDPNRAKRVSSKTFYPGYIFVQMALTDKAWHVVRDTPRSPGSSAAAIRSRCRHPRFSRSSNRWKRVRPSHARA